MKKTRIILALSLFIIAGVFASSCSSSKNSAYPKRLQRSVKCSGIQYNDINKNNQQTIVVAYTETMQTSMLK